MYKIFIIIVISLFILFFSSCSKISQNDLKGVQVVCNPNLQRVIDSLVAENKQNTNKLELIVDKTVEFRCDMILHIGTESQYKNNELSLCYLLSNGKKIDIYSGIESYFNLPDRQIKYEKYRIEDDKDHQTWIIHMYKDSILDVYRGESVIPFLLIPPSPRYFMKIENDN